MSHPLFNRDFVQSIPLAIRHPRERHGGDVYRESDTVRGELNAHCLAFSEVAVVLQITP